MFSKNQGFPERKTNGWWWWHRHLIPALRRQRQADLCEFKASLVYRASSRTESIATGKPCLKKQKKERKKGRKGGRKEGRKEREEKVGADDSSSGNQAQAQHVTQLVEGLPSRLEALGLIPSPE